MKNYDRLSEIKPSNNEYVFLKNTVNSKPKELLYVSGTFIDFEENELKVNEDAFWRPVYATNPITHDLCKIILDEKELPKGSEVDGYASNEYVTTFLNRGRRYMLVHKEKNIETIWTEALDD